MSEQRHGRKTARGKRADGDTRMTRRVKLAREQQRKDRLVRRVIREVYA